MSVALQRASNLVSLAVANVALNPAITAALLYLLTKAPERVRSQLTSRIAALRDPHKFIRIVKALKWCLALGVAGVVNRRLNHVALNAGRWKSEKQRWNFSGTGKGEVAVVTGGCSGIGELIVKRLVNKGAKVAIMDIQELPRSLQGCKLIFNFS